MQYFTDNKKVNDIIETIGDKKITTAELEKLV
jgi:hypothetical protein